MRTTIRNEHVAQAIPLAWYDNPVCNGCVSNRVLISDFNASRHYLTGPPQLRVSVKNERGHAFSGAKAHMTREPSSRIGLAAGFGTMNGDFTLLGFTSDWGNETAFGLSRADARQHLYVLGKSGSGKSTLLKNLIIQHIESGNGVGLIDPHGDLAEELLYHIPRSRVNDLVYFNPGDLDFPIGWNLLADVPVDDRHLVASGIVGAFKNIWGDSWGPRLEYILHNAISALLDCPGATLLGVNRLLTDAAFRAGVVSQIRDPFIREFWTNEYENYDERFRREAIAPIQNKVGQFLLNPVIRNILGQVKNRVNFPFIMDTGRIFIANLSKGRLGHDKANLLGSLLVTQFQLAAMARSGLPEEKRRDWFLVIDEFQNFSTEAFAAVLSEARKYRLCLVLSNQFVDQISLPVRQAVFGNMGTIISFRIGYSDAEVLAKEFSNTYPAKALVDLDQFEIVVKLLQNGANLEPFRGRSFPPEWKRAADVARLVAHSRERFSTPRAKVEDKLKRWMRPTDLVEE